MKTTRGSFDTQGQDGWECSTADELDALLALAPRYTPSAGFAERVLTALHEEEQKATLPVAPLPRPWYLRPYSWGSAAAAACLVATLSLLPLQEAAAPLPADSLALDDAVLVDEVLDSIDDPDLVSAICCVSAGSYSISTGRGAY